MREDSLAFLHGRSGCLAVGPVRRYVHAWASHNGMPRRCVSVVRPCEEVKTRGHQPENWLRSEAKPTRIVYPNLILRHLDELSFCSVLQTHKGGDSAAGWWRCPSCSIPVWQGQESGPLCKSW